MQIPDDALVDDLCWPDLIEALRRQFRDGCEVPERHHHGMEVQGEAEATMLPMPAWQPGNRIGVKLVNVFPGYSQRGLPGISADYLLYDGKTGQGPTTMNGNIITGHSSSSLPRRDSGPQLERSNHPLQGRGHCTRRPRHRLAGL